MTRRGRTTLQSAALMLAAGTMGLAAVRSLAAPQARPAKKAALVAKAPSYARDVRAVFQAQCVSCHGKNSAAAGLDLSRFATEAAAMNDLGAIEKAMGKVVAGEMPPGRPLPVAQRRAFQAWTENALAAQCRLADPGRVTLRRLNRAEYNNTVHDLLGTDLRPADDFPGDDVGNGFDNMGDVLSVSPLLMEKLLDSAERLARDAVFVPRVRTRRFAGSDFKGGSLTPLDTGNAMIASGGENDREVNNLPPGDYRMRVSLYGVLAKGAPEAPKARLLVDGKSVGEFDVPNTHPKSFEVAAPVGFADGSHRIGVEFLNDYYDEKTKADRNLGLESVELTGPLGKPQYPSIHKRIVPYEPERGQEETARRFIAAFAGRAFRRPATPQDLDRLMPVFDAGFKGGTFDEGMRLAVQAVLSSPRFLFRLEQDPPGSANRVRSLDGYEVASRLSYFLWSTMPDDTLTSLAASGKLVQPAVLRAQVQRMIADPRAQAMADNFAAQWLNLRKLAIVEPDPKQFPDCDAKTREDMATETKTFFLSVLRNGRPITDFIDGPYTFLDERLARYYGIPGVMGPDFRRVALVGGDRAGVLTQASVLTLTSNPTRTSPTKRGKWVLENIFGTPPPPPPPGVSDIKDEAHKLEGLTLRQLMEEHRKNPACAVCHQKMDPIGFGMENFDAAGHWRTMEGKVPVDASGTLPGGVSFRGPAQLRGIILRQKGLFAHALAEKLLAYALGRGVDFKDKCALDASVAATERSGYRLDALVAAVVTSDPFLKRKGNAQ